MLQRTHFLLFTEMYFEPTIQVDELPDQEMVYEDELEAGSDEVFITPNWVIDFEPPVISKFQENAQPILFWNVDSR